MCKNVSFPLVLALLIASLMVIATSSASPSMTENSWTTKASMNEARAYLGVAVVNGKIYAIGGDTGIEVGSPGGGRTSNVVAVNEEYNPATDTWVLKKSMPTPRAGLGTAVYKNKIYCIGGWKEDYSNTGANEVYDPATDTWEVKTPLPSPAEFVAVSVVKDKIYVLQLGTTDAFNAYDPVTDSWASKTPPPYEVTGFTTAVMENKIFFEGAYGNASMNSDIQIYDTISDSWSTVTTRLGTYDLKGSGGVTSGVKSSVRIYFFYETVTKVYDPVNDSWSVGASMQTPRFCAGSTVVDDTFYVVGGRPGPVGLLTVISPSAVTEQYVPFGYKTDSTQPDIAVQSPEAKTYYGSDVSLNFTVNEPVVWMQYSLDAQDNVTIAGNTTLSQLSYGLHNVTIYAQDNAENVGASETIIFTIAMAPKPPEPFPTALVVASTGTVAIVGVGLLVYFRKRKR